MSDYYSNPGALRAAEDRLATMAKELEEARKTIRDMFADYDAASLRNKLKQINDYDEDVQAIIAADSNLAQAWDNFRVLYELTARKELLQTAREKMRGEREGICHGCKRRFTKGIQ